MIDQHVCAHCAHTVLSSCFELFVGIQQQQGLLLNAAAAQVKSGLNSMVVECDPELIERRILPLPYVLCAPIRMWNYLHAPKFSFECFQCNVDANLSCLHA